MIRRLLARLVFRLGAWLDPEHALAVRGLPRARALYLPPPSTPDELLDDSLAGRSEAAPEEAAIETVEATPKPSEPLQCAIAKGSEYTEEPIPMSLARMNALLGGNRPTTMRRYKAPYHVLVDGHLACEPSWKPESGSTHSVLDIQAIRLCRAPACRALWQPERDRVRAAGAKGA
jgi:hypothetical protein